MRKPEIIEKDIELLQNELKKSKLEHQYELLCTSEWSSEMIGFFNMGNANKILTLLNNGAKLQYRHDIFGNVDVQMNGNGNRIIVSSNKDITEENIMGFIIWHTGDWYIDTSYLNT